MNTSRPRTLSVTLVSLLALGSLAACGSDDADSGTDTSTPSSSASSESGAGANDESGSSGSGTRALTADGSLAGKCAMPSAETLATFDTAFAGTVTSIDGGTATLEVDQWYAGEEASTVTVEAPGDDLQDLLMAVDFQEGAAYLVSADGDRVSLCGFSGEQSPELEALYAEAFAS
ncbi:hypothetical protein SFC79_14835 [Nocardioides sp. S-58]|uniref:Uncharacterized protein n=1 Tax=Nocardioides renjunii TaxID=3095075 RepID=A0ABU5KDL3_9ACTN|nr:MULTISPECIES: hypothetical protein [unclassified Nocardioides]MDZ5663051.1 hypothetical protein [Nocardioides sp. S-58]WQQ23072.1 hypothetical protein SHK17_03650 [Nocardioides sp. S-34]